MPKWYGYRKDALEKRLLKRIVKQENDGCWIWVGARTSNGHGSISLKYQTHYTHRVAYTLWAGPIPPGQSVYHHCNNPACCRPDHLYVSKDMTSLEERLLRKIEKQENGCWLWRGAVQKGYGQIGLLGRERAAHRLAYALWVEPIPNGLVVLHLCGCRDGLRDRTTHDRVQAERQ
jgi:hypothetical protein